jgi:hypothetical protein
LRLRLIVLGAKRGSGNGYGDDKCRQENTSLSNSVSRVVATGRNHFAQLWHNRCRHSFEGKDR